jgi:hypothetical protein
MALSTVCETKEGGIWKSIAVSDALQIPRRQRQLRCPESVCHKPVRPHKRGSNGASAHFEHLEWNPKCPRRQQHRTS